MLLLRVLNKFLLFNCSFLCWISEDVTSFDKNFYNGVVSVLGHYGLPMKLPAKIVIIVRDQILKINSLERIQI